MHRVLRCGRRDRCQPGGTAPGQIVQGLNRTQLRLRSLRISPVSIDCTEALTQTGTLLSRRHRDGLTSLEQLPFNRWPRSLEILRGLARFSNLRSLSLVQVDVRTLPPAGMARLPAGLQVLSITADVATSVLAIASLLQGLDRLHSLLLKGFCKVSTFSRLPASLQLVTLAACELRLSEAVVKQPLPAATLRVAAARLVLVGRGACPGTTMSSDDDPFLDGGSPLGEFRALHLSFSYLVLSEGCAACCAGDACPGSVGGNVAAKFVEFIVLNHLSAVVEVQSIAGNGSFVIQWPSCDRRSLCGHYASAYALAEACADACLRAQISCCVVRRGGCDIVVMRRMVL